MQPRLMRVLIVVIGVVIGSTAAYFLKDIETQVNDARGGADTLRERAHGLRSAIADIRASQFAYVAYGQGEAFWIDRVERLTPALEARAAEFGAALTTAASQSAFEPAITALQNFKSLDGQVREFVTTGNSLLAADLIFSDGLEATATASAAVDAALHEELRWRRAGLDALRSRQIAILGGAAGSALLMLIMLAVPARGEANAAAAEAAPAPAEPVRFEAPLPRAKPAITPKLVNTAQLCADLARVADGRQLPDLLERASKILDASGIVVWVADPGGGQLRPVMAHGYAEQMVAKMGAIPREANNAAAAAFRAGQLRTVAGDSFTSGAVIAPLMTPGGCVGVLSAEMKGGSEKDESAQALATIFAAQFATLVAVEGTETSEGAESREGTEQPQHRATESQRSQRMASL